MDQVQAVLLLRISETELEADTAAGRYRVTHVYEDGPADKDWGWRESWRLPARD